MRFPRTFMLFVAVCLSAGLVAALAAGDNPNHHWFWSGWFSGIVMVAAWLAIDAIWQER